MAATTPAADVFDYYGSKRQLGHLYPEPGHDLIVEPFAGSAGYALYGDNWRKQVLLFEPDPEVFSLWRWLITEATAGDLLELPSPGDGLGRQDLDGPPRVLLEVMARLGGGPPEGRRRASPWEERRARLAADLAKVRHWEVRCAGYEAAPDVEATWFVDPPYEGAVGSTYAFGSPRLDFAGLAAWTRSRRGQVIACESGCATYLPFGPLRPGVDRRGDPHAEFLWCRRSLPGVAATR